MDYAKRIMELKKELNAVLLVHNYQRPEIQDVADYLGDSLGLSMEASRTDKKVIVFCGVNFMAETAAILNPDKLVLHPEPDAKCPMAGMIDVDGLRKYKSEHPEAKVVAYVNTTAEVKAEADICCTSANAVKVCQSIPDKEIIFVPDTNLGLYVMRFVKDKKIHLWPGYCHTHRDITKKEIEELLVLHPKSEVLAHPECVPEVVDMADFVGSTEGIVKYVRNSPKHEFIVATEKEMCYRLKKENPNKEFYPPPSALCPNMKKITIEKVVQSMEQKIYPVRIDERVREKAYQPIKRMLEYTK
ncbi:MAG: quinolinate synthase NadA [Thermoplasmata archaeon]